MEEQSNRLVEIDAHHMVLAELQTLIGLISGSIL
jgi:hypothetical protein